MAHPEHPNPLYHPISGYEVLGVERDAERWIGADVALTIPAAGKFLLNMVTRTAFRHEVTREVVEFPTSVRPEMFAASVEHRDPFVVNDDQLSRTVLDRELTGTVGPDLAACLWYDGPIDRA